MSTHDPPEIEGVWPIYDGTGDFRIRFRVLRRLLRREREWHILISQVRHYQRLSTPVENEVLVSKRWITSKLGYVPDSLPAAEWINPRGVPYWRVDTLRQWLASPAGLGAIKEGLQT